MSETLVYLAGPMTGATPNYCHEWRNEASKFLKPLGFRCLSPLRGKYYESDDIPMQAFPERQMMESDMQRVLASAKGIFGRDHYDVKRSDIIIANFNASPQISIGTVMELALAYAYKKPVVATLDERHDHPFVVETITHLCPDLDTVLRVTATLR